MAEAMRRLHIREERKGKKLVGQVFQGGNSGAFQRHAEVQMAGQGALGEGGAAHRAQPDADANKAKAVRQAVANLIDREELSTKVYKGTYTPMYSFIPDGLAGHDDTLKSAYGDGNGKPSTEKAKKDLADAGDTAPVDLTLQ